ncbi:MAG: radical SAM family heme chaperone HemW [Gaiellales bacterium]
MGDVRHLYVHVPFCAHRCGYCDFVTVTGHDERHGAYVDAVLRELDARGAVLGAVETVYVGGGTPSRLGAAELGRLLDALPQAAVETTVECNPEGVDEELAAALGRRGVRVSLGAQTFAQPLLDVLERRTTPDQVRAAVALLRTARVASLSLDLIYGIPGERESDLARDLATLEELAPDHVSAYELEAKPGTRFTVHHGAALAEQAELLERHMDLVIDSLGYSGYAWYEIASFARAPDHQGRHNRAYWEGRDYLGLGVGAVGTVGGERRVNGPKLTAYLADPAGAPAAIELLDDRTRQEERLMLGLRLAEGVEQSAVADVLDEAGLERLTGLGLAEVADGRIRLQRRGRMLLHDCVAELMNDEPA